MLNTGHYAYQTHEDGLCEFDTAAEAIAEATRRASQEGEQITVYTPDGDVLRVVRCDLPTHADRCAHPEIYGYED